MSIPGSDISTTPTKTISTKLQHTNEVQSVKCHSCGFTEDCTHAYISRVRDRYQGRWLCGLCIEAVKDEVIRSDKVISIEEALNRHISVCTKFRSSKPLMEQFENPILAMGRILRRSLDSRRRRIRINSSNSLSDVDRIKEAPVLVRSDSCFPALSR